jgi:hypothetical protein
MWLNCAATVKKSVLQDDNFKFDVMKNLPKHANIALLFIRMCMPVAKVVLPDCSAKLK